MSWFNDLVRNLSFILDKVVYTLIDWVYKLFISLAQVNISDTVTNSFAGRIYVFLGIFMLFRIAFSLITYLINPDNLKDNKKGGGAIIKNVFISILLMALVPTIFKEAYAIQKIILEENIIGQIIMGQPVKGDSTDHSGQMMAYTVFSAFFSPEVDDSSCDSPFLNGTLTANCKTKLVSIAGESVAQTYEDAYKELKISKLDSIINAKDSNGTYIFHYLPFISTAAGGFVAWILVIFCIDLALRIVKLAFLQLIAPIPIISYIDPQER